MKTRVPVALAITVGLFMGIEPFVANPWVADLRAWVLDTAVLVVAFAFLPLTVIFFLRELKGLRTETKARPERLTTLLALVTTLVVGLATGADGAVWTWLFESIYAPLQATLLALLAFFTVTALSRFVGEARPRQGLFLAVLVLVLVARTPWIAGLWPGWLALEQWVFEVPNLAARRALVIGAALGGATVALRVVLGLETGWFREERP